METIKGIEWTPDEGRPECRIAKARRDLLEYLRIDDVIISQFCRHVFNYEPYVIDIIEAASECDLFRDHPASWLAMRNILKDKHERRHGRNCWAAAKDILTDGLWTDMLALYMRQTHGGGILRNNNANDLWSKATLLPDFEILGGKALLEMKTEADMGNNWSGKTHTIRPADIEREYSRYAEYDKPGRPLYYLLINTTAKEFAIIPHSAYRPSRAGDGSIYAFYEPHKIPDSFTALAQALGKALGELHKG